MFHIGRDTPLTVSTDSFHLKIRIFNKLSQVLTTILPG